MEKFTLDWLLNNWQIVLGAIGTFLISFKIIISQIKAVVEPIATMISNSINKKSQMKELVMTKYQESMEKRDLEDKVATWQTKLDILEGDAKLIALDRIKLYEEELVKYG
jgi:uncharacterized protein YicC (UPF0701 family)